MNKSLYESNFFLFMTPKNGVLVGGIHGKAFNRVFYGLNCSLIIPAVI